jgi:hypothetical protein
MIGLSINRPFQVNCYGKTQSQSKKTLSTSRIQATIRPRIPRIRINSIPRIDGEFRCRTVHRTGRFTRTYGLIHRPHSIRQQRRRDHAQRDNRNSRPCYDGRHGQRQGQYRAHGCGLDRNRRIFQNTKVGTPKAAQQRSAQPNQSVLRQRSAKALLEVI